MNVVELIRGLVRPTVTWLVVLALVFALIYLVIKFADIDMAKTVLVGFMTLVGTIAGFWFASRTKTTPPTNGGQ